MASGLDCEKEDADVLLGKSCTKANNIKNGTIKLGTLHEYRSTENLEILDRKEGMLSFFLKFDGNVRVNSKWLDSMTESICFIETPMANLPGLVRSKINFKVTGIEKEHVTLTDSSATIYREALNTFVFCISSVMEKHECVGMFKGYDDYWYLNQSSAQEFGLRLCDILLTYIVDQHDEGNYILPKETNLQNLEIKLRGGLVYYVAREIHITGDGDIALEKFRSTVMHMAFIKPEEFQHEKEFRFELTAVVDGMIVEPVVKFVILDSSSLTHLLF